MSDLITADLVLLDENLGDTRFDVIAKLAEAVVKAAARPTLSNSTRLLRLASPRPTPVFPAVLLSRTAAVPLSPSRPWPWLAPTPPYRSALRTAPPT